MMQSFAKLGVMRLAALAGVGAAMIVFFVFITTKLGTPGMSLLYGDLDLKDSAQITQKLEAMNIPYQLRADGAQILVPGDQVARARMAMAEQGLPRGGSIGYELFDKSDSFGTSTFAQNINQLRALEGELERTIAGLSPVEAARVHLVMPRRDLFQRDGQEASASIVLKLRNAERLSKGQVAAIEHLAASAVPGLKPSRVAIVDGDGNMLARGNGDDPGAGNAEADEQRLTYETTLSRRVEDLLERTLGPGKVRVDVTADMNFDRVTTSSETFDPDGQVVLSTQTNTQNDDSSNGTTAQPVTVTSNLPGNQTTPPANNNNNSRTKNTHNEETTNYSNSKTVRTLVHDGGEVKHLSVAVLVDGTYSQKPDGTKEYTPRSPDEIKQITTLVRSAIGFNEKRGDTLDVVNLQFAKPDQPAAPTEAATTILGFERGDVMRMGEMLVIAVVALLVILLVIRPLMFKLLDSGFASSAPEPGALLTDGGAGGAPALPPPPGMQSAQAGAAVAMPITPPPARQQIDQMIDIGQVDGRVAASSIRKIGEIVEKHPEEAVAIVRSWMYQGV